MFFLLKYKNINQKYIGKKYLYSQYTVYSIYIALEWKLKKRVKFNFLCMYEQWYIVTLIL